MEWFTVGLDGIWIVVASAIIVFAILIVLTRIAGLRSFSKMSSFDFATTVAMGTIMSSTMITEDPPVLQGITALGMLFLLQYAVARVRRDTGWATKVFDNEPLLLMSRGEFIEENMTASRVTDTDIWAKLREANVHDLSEVDAVILETTGDVSVLHTHDPHRKLDPKILTGVRDAAIFERPLWVAEKTTSDIIVPG